MKKFITVLHFLIIFNIYADIELTPEELEGKKKFMTHCSDCHKLEGVLVGPSLVEIAHVYKDDKRGIITWAMRPGNKRADTLPMPPMLHVGKENLLKITNYIFAVTEGKEYKTSKKNEMFCTALVALMVFYYFYRKKLKKRMPKLQ
ncbi:MAG: cytochrome c [Lentisphaerales bacterium]|nr:cytochrome c [Lentisphaerales bacterium]